MFKSMKIETRVLTGFGCMVLLALVLGAAAIVKLAAMNSHWQEFESVTLARKDAVFAGADKPMGAAFQKLLVLNEKDTEVKPAQIAVVMASARLWILSVGALAVLLGVVLAVWIMRDLTQIMRDVRRVADSLSGASAQVSATAQSLSQASSEQAATAEEMSGQAEQLQQLMAFFKVDAGGGAQVLKFSAHKPAAAAKAAVAKPAALRVAGNLALAASAEPSEAQFAKF